MNSARHIAHSDDDEHHVISTGDDSGGEAANETVGSPLMAFFMSPFGGGEGWSEVELCRRWQVHRETRTHTSAQSTPVETQDL